VNDASTGLRLQIIALPAHKNTKQYSFKRRAVTFCIHGVNQNISFGNFRISSLNVYALWLQFSNNIRCWEGFDVNMGGGRCKKCLRESNWRFILLWRRSGLWILSRPRGWTLSQGY